MELYMYIYVQWDNHGKYLGFTLRLSNIVMEAMACLKNISDDLLVTNNAFP